MSDSNLTIDDLNALPEKMRAHAAAKAVGMTSKEFLAAMAGIGVEIKSAQSGVTRDVLITWFRGRDDADAATETEKAAPAEKTARQAPAAKSPAKKAPARKSAAKRPAKEAAPAGEESPTAGGSGRGSGSGERPELPEIAIVTGEVGADEAGGRRRRSTATPSYSPLFLSPDEAGGDARSGKAADSGRGKGGGKGSGSGSDSGKGSGSDSGNGAGSGSGAGSDSGNDNRDDNDNGDDNDNDTDNGDGSGRRRRRGRRGRGRGRGENSDDQNGSGGGPGDSSDNSDAGDSADDAPGGSGDGSSQNGSSQDDSSGDGQNGRDGSGESPSGSRRRRRRRRRGGGGGSSDGQQNQGDDPPNTEVHEREPRRRSGRGGQGSGTSADEVRGISGSTRLEAKRQRRRDGREAGRRRQPILSEAEFLARRESVDRVMVVREKDRADGRGVMTQVGVLEDKVLVEHFVTTESARSMVGNVYLGRVQNVLPSMEAAFVDIGRGRNGVLYAGEVNWEAAGLGGKARRIEQALKPGDMVLVQVTKDPIGQKGARLSTQISLAGRFLVYVPHGNSTGISRKLPDTERRRLKAILKDVVPEGSGVIIRTAAEGVSEEEIGRDVERLAAQWSQISAAADKRNSSKSGNPVTLHEEPDLLIKVVRDLFNEDFSKLVIQGGSSWDTVHDYVSRVAPEMVDRLERYDNAEVDVFAAHRVDEQLAKALDRKVWLPSGGSLVIDRTEAMTVIDVNTGKYTGSGGNLEETVSKNNLEAAEEIVRQLRLRDIGGMVIVDFIDMVLESNRDLVLRRLTEALGRDRTRHQVSEVTSLGLVQLTRKKLGTGLVEAFSTPCEHCHGRGLLVHADPVHTESHNSDDSGGRRGRRRGKGSGGNGQSDAPRQSPRKDGPAPSEHPAALAMGRHEQATSDGEGSRGTTPDSTTKSKTATPDTERSPAVATAEPVEAGDDAKSSASAEKASGATAPSGGSSRPRRRRASGRGAGGAVTPSTEDVAADTSDNAPAADEKTVVAEADAAVAEVTGVDGAAATSTPTSTPTSGRPRRRSTRREAGAAAQAAGAESAPTPAPEPAVEAATLAEAPTAVVAEPRTRPARRRARRSSVAPGTDES